MISVPGTNVRPARLRGWHLIGISLAMLFLCLAAWLVGAVRDAREAARRTQCRGHFCGITLALHNYHDVYGCFPPAYVAGPDGTPWHSWRVLLLPFLDESRLYDRYRFDEPWNGPHNWPLVKDVRLELLQCPSRSDHEVTPFTNYVVVVGEGTVFPGADSVSLHQIDAEQQAVLVAEAAGLEIHWAEPRDLDLAAMSFRVNDPHAPSISSPHPLGALVSYVHGSCSGSWLPADTSEAEVLRQLIVTPPEPEKLPDE
jgi:Protein of unknown function (DUF1559)